jgi:hypothetical protein
LDFTWEKWDFSDPHPLIPIVPITHDLDISGQASRQIRLKNGKVLTDERVHSNGALTGVA